MSLPGYTWQCRSKNTDTIFSTLQDKYLCLALENVIRGGIVSVMGERDVKSDENKKIMCIDAKNLYGWAMCESLPYNETKIDGSSHGLDDLPGIFCIKVE